MDHTKDPATRIAGFLSDVRRSVSAGCRVAGDGETALKLEMRCRDGVDGKERILGLRAGLRDGVPVIELYEVPELAPTKGTTP